MNIEKEILEIKERNKRVEGDKAWEVSVVRKLIIFFLTYIFAVLWLYEIHEPIFWLKAFVPAVGYLISTFSLAKAKEFWQKNN
jgi:hypothetical protein